jgi:mono/diheme cytochrome c family protein
MSCGDEKNCRESMKRRRALAVFGFMMVCFILLSAFSFLGSRGQVTPDMITYSSHKATDGKRVFQAYNCMGCHTIVGNGSYFAPDLTETYALAGPAWLAAFLPSAGGWPTEAAVRTQLANATVSADAGVTSIEEYYKKFPGAKERVDRRGGHKSLMPNLPFNGEEVPQLIAFLKYSSAMDTEGWPPEVRTGTLEQRLALLNGSTVVASANAAPVSTSAAAVAAPVAAVDPVERGKTLTTDFGCIACHATDTTKLVGPGWGGLHGHAVKLADGSTVTADDAYLTEAIRAPNNQLVEGYSPGLMPAYDVSLMSDDDVNAIVAYIRSLEAK